MLPAFFFCSKLFKEFKSCHNLVFLGKFSRFNAILRRRGTIAESQVSLLAASAMFFVLEFVKYLNSGKSLKNDSGNISNALRD